MFKILSTYICWKKIYKMQHLEGSCTPVLYIGRTVLKGYITMLGPLNVRHQMENLQVLIPSIKCNTQTYERSSF